MFQCCVTVVEMTPGRSGNHRVSSSLLWAMHAPFHVLVALLYSTYRTFHVATVAFSRILPSLLFFFWFLFFIVLFVIYPVGSPLFFQFRVTGAWAGVGFWQVGLMAGLWLGQALRCSSYLGLGSAVPAPMFLSTQPPYAT